LELYAGEIDRLLNASTEYTILEAFDMWRSNATFDCNQFEHQLPRMTYRTRVKAHQFMTKIEVDLLTTFLNRNRQDESQSRTPDVIGGDELRIRE